MLAVFFLVFVGLTASRCGERLPAGHLVRPDQRCGGTAGRVERDNPILILSLAVVRQLLELAGIFVVCRLSGRLMAERDGATDRRGELTWRLCVLCGACGISAAYPSLSSI